MVSLPERSEPHGDLAGYVVGGLEPDERARFEEHLERCPDCRRQVEELRPVAAMAAGAAPAFAPPADLDQKVLAAVARAAEEDARAARPAAQRTVRPARSFRGWFVPRRGTGLALALGLVVAIAVAVALPRAGDDGGLPVPAGEPELMAELVSSGRPGQTATARVDMLGTGRVVSFNSDDLPILPKGEYYELWFVAPGDTRDDPDRISAGTFHPDEEGRSRVRFHAAVDPKRYPVLSVTAEPGDGDPRPSGEEVLRSRP